MNLSLNALVTVIQFVCKNATKRGAISTYFLDWWNLRFSVMKYFKLNLRNIKIHTCIFFLFRISETFFVSVHLFYFSPRVIFFSILYLNSHSTYSIKFKYYLGKFPVRPGNNSEYYLNFIKGPELREQEKFYKH